LSIAIVQKPYTALWELKIFGLINTAHFDGLIS
jgi:hypothetical protein